MYGAQKKQMSHTDELATFEEGSKVLSMRQPDYGSLK
jgi:hypothetical protein